MNESAWLIFTSSIICSAAWCKLSNGLRGVSVPLHARRQKTVWGSFAYSQASWLHSFLCSQASWLHSFLSVQKQASWLHSFMCPQASWLHSFLCPLLVSYFLCPWSMHIVIAYPYSQKLFESLVCPCLLLVVLSSLCVYSLVSFSCVWNCGRLLLVLLLSFVRMGATVFDIDATIKNSKIQVDFLCYHKWKGHIKGWTTDEKIKQSHLMVKNFQ